MGHKIMEWDERQNPRGAMLTHTTLDLFDSTDPLSKIGNGWAEKDAGRNN